MLTDKPGTPCTEDSQTHRQKFRRRLGRDAADANVAGALARAQRCYSCDSIAAIGSMKTRRHPQNRKYITSQLPRVGAPNHSHWQHAQKLGELRSCGFRDMWANRQQTHRRLNKYTHSTSLPCKWSSVLDCGVLGFRIKTSHSELTTRNPLSRSHLTHPAKWE